MKKLLAIVSIVIFVLIASAFSHKFYVSITRIDHNPTAQTLELTVKIFNDDFEDALTAQNGKKVLLATDIETAATDEMVFGYVSDKLKIKVNEKPVTYRYVGKEVEFDVTWVYLEVAEIPNVSTLEVTNRLLLELFDEQTNVVHIRAAGKEKSLLLRAGDSVQSVQFN